MTKREIQKMEIEAELALSSTNKTRRKDLKAMLSEVKILISMGR